MTETMAHHKWGTDPEKRYRDWLGDVAATCERIVEVGCFAGSTTRRMAERTPGVVWAVDHWKGVPGDPVQSKIYRNMSRTKAEFFRRCDQVIEEGKVQVLQRSSVRAARYLRRRFGRAFDLVFIDADHRYRSVKRDIRAWRPLVRPGGILCGHDVTWPGVRKAVDELVPGWKRGPGTLWIKRIPGGKLR